MTLDDDASDQVCIHDWWPPRVVTYTTHPSEDTTAWTHELHTAAPEDLTQRSSNQSEDEVFSRHGVTSLL